MPLKEPNNINMIWLAVLMFKDIFLGLIGGAIAYLFDFSKARKNGKEFSFQISAMLINMAFGAFVAYVIGSMIPIETAGRDAIIGMSGVTSYQILLLVESRYAMWIFNKLTNDSAKEDKKEKDK